MLGAGEAQPGSEQTAGQAAGGARRQGGGRHTPTAGGIHKQYTTLLISKPQLSKYQLSNCIVPFPTLHFPLVIQIFTLIQLVLVVVKTVIEFLHKRKES